MIRSFWCGHVGTTTWPERHKSTFSDLADSIAKLDLEVAVVLDVGPGAVSTFLHKRLAGGEGEHLSFFGNRYRAMLRNIDSLIRRLPTTSLYSYEPGELLAVLPTNSRLFVTDISPRVIDAVRQQYPHLDARVFDFAADRFETSADVIVSLCVLVRAREAGRMFANLYRSLRPGGLFVIDRRSAARFGSDNMPLERLTGQLWRKPP